MMAASPVQPDASSIPPPEKWDHPPPHDIQHVDPSVLPGDDLHHHHHHHHHRPDDRPRLPDQQQPPENIPLSDSADVLSPSNQQSDPPYRGEKQIKPNKVYIGGLPEHTRKEDLENCFVKIGTIVNIELKLGYGFVEFDTREAAEESVAKYHEGYFMGNKIRVELSRGGGRTAKYNGDPGACFKCGQVGHWARECPNHSPQATGPTRPGSYTSDAPLIDRIQPSREYPPPRDYGTYREDYGRYPLPPLPPPRDARYYDYPPPTPSRDYRRPPSPARDYRDYPPPPPPAARSTREMDDYRMRGAPAPAPAARYEARTGYYGPENDGMATTGYPPRVFGPPPIRDYYDRYDRRGPATNDRYSYPPPPAGRPRSPPGAGARGRDDYDRPPTREYPPAPPPADYRGRGASPPPHAHAPPPPPPGRYGEYPARAGSSEARYRRRSQSPPPRGNSGGYDGGYPPGGGGYGGNGYGGGTSSRGSTGGREYPPSRGRDGESGGYRRN